MVVKTTEAGSGSAPDIVFARDSSSPADNDFLGKIVFRGKNDASEDVEYAQIISQLIDASDGTEDGKLYLQTKVNGSDTNVAVMDSSGVTVAGSVTSEGGDNLFRNSSGNSIVSIIAGTSNSSILKLGDTADFDVGQIEYNHSSNYLAIKTNDTERFRIDDNGHITKPSQSAFSVELTSEAENKTGNGTGFQLGALGSTERFDRNGDVSNFIFTAPVDGLYLISVMIMYDGFGSASSGFAQIQTSNRIYQCALFHPSNSANVGVNHQIVATYLCDMDANDTAQPLLYISGAGSDSVDLQATETRMSGILVA